MSLALVLLEKSFTRMGMCTLQSDAIMPADIITRKTLKIKLNNLTVFKLNNGLTESEKYCQMEDSQAMTFYKLLSYFEALKATRKMFLLTKKSIPKG